jgi:hypothetical protein
MKATIRARFHAFVSRSLCGIGLHAWQVTRLGRWERDGTNFECRRCKIGIRKRGDVIGFSETNAHIEGFGALATNTLRCVVREMFIHFAVSGVVS